MFLHQVRWAVLALLSSAVLFGCTGKKNVPSTTPTLPPAATYTVQLDPTQDFSGCSGSISDESTDITCEDQVLMLVETTELASGGLVEMMRSSLKTSLEDSSQFLEDPIALSIDKNLFTVLRLSAYSKEDNSVLVGRFFVLSVTDTTKFTRGAMCMTPGDSDEEAELCLRRVGSLVLKGPPAGIELVDGRQPPMFLGRELSIAEGCAVGDHNSLMGRIDCEEASLAWFLMGTREQANEVLAEIRKEFQDPEQFKLIAQDTRCELDGHLTDCQLYTGTLQDGTPMNALLAQVEIEAQFAVSLCMSANSSDVMHPVCNTLLAVP